MYILQHDLSYTSCRQSWELMYISFMLNNKQQQKTQSIFLHFEWLFLGFRPFFLGHKSSHDSATSAIGSPKVSPGETCDATRHGSARPTKHAWTKSQWTNLFCKNETDFTWEIVMTPVMTWHMMIIQKCKFTMLNKKKIQKRTPMKAATTVVPEQERRAAESKGIGSVWML